MGRLTRGDDKGNASLVACKAKQCIDEKGNTCQYISLPECRSQRAINKLAAYEQAEEAGLLIKLPVKVGQTVYKTLNTHCGNCVNFSSNCNGLCCPLPKVVESKFDFDQLKNWGKFIFATREEAEEVLEAHNHV